MASASATIPERGQRTAFLPAFAPAAIFVLTALALKLTTFGDTNRSADELFYFFVGQRMHEGLLPYVDVWDRKPLGLFIAYWLIAGLSLSVLAYQIAACLLAATTAWVIARIVKRWAGWRGGLLAGLAYLFMVVTFEGATGQAPDFYNPLIAGAALLIASEMDHLVRGIVGWRTWLAMLFGGLAITVKHTAFFEAAFFGFYVVATLCRAGVPWPRVAGIAAASMAIGAIPSLFIAAYYWQGGHWHEFWHAMVTSNFAKAGYGGKGLRLTGILLRLALLLPFALWGLARADRGVRVFLGGWLLAAVVGFVALPNFTVHYTLPVLVPLCVAAGLLFGSHRAWLVMAVALALYAILWSLPAGRERARDNAQAMGQAASLIRQHDSGGGLLVYDGPSYLYAMAGKPVLSPLVFPHHLASQLENDVSHLGTRAEIDRVVAGRPGVVVMAQKPIIAPINAYTRLKVLTYVRTTCRVVGTMTLHDAGIRVPFVIFGDCSRAGRREP